MGRSLLIIGIGVLFGGLVAWMVISSAPPPSNQPDVTGIRMPQTGRQPAR